MTEQPKNDQQKYQAPAALEEAYTSCLVDSCKISASIAQVSDLSILFVHLPQDEKVELHIKSFSEKGENLDTNLCP